MSARTVPDDAAGRAQAIESLRRGGVVALPTDTVYGIAVALDAPDGIERLFRVKRRPPERGIVLLLDEATQAPIDRGDGAGRNGTRRRVLAGRADRRRSATTRRSVARRH